jgi:hypothetical protein
MTTLSSHKPRKEKQKIVLDDTEGAQANLADEGKPRCI